eukprot:CAMPEP_0117444728 /NCGR_PEP_ID=MMETSP0759-20121206/5401_1 /TAXON_ID=63605 /ORGANISM="Percolomonas cosmopolitus, Strain WS" /LENGTH=107 /DNA_ID=CAMNT_0005236825 /DNA_START=16 /DNA_END=339 /DNA_ORIENTATION=+
MSSSASSSSSITQHPNIPPLSIIDKCIDSPIYIILKDSKQISGILKGFDDYVNMILEDVVEYDYDENGNRVEIPNPKGVLLNGSNIAIMVPGSRGTQREHEVFEWNE